MTSVIVPSLIATDFIFDPAVSEHASTNLKAVTLLRLHKLATIHETDVMRKIGRISSTVESEIERRLRLLLTLP